MVFLLLVRRYWTESYKFSFSYMTFQTKNKLSSTSATILAVRIRQRFPMGSWELLFQLIGLLLLG
jgi:hypothetical protein